MIYIFLHLSILCTRAVIMLGYYIIVLHILCVIYIYCLAYIHHSSIAEHGSHVQARYQRYSIHLLSLML